MVAYAPVGVVCYTLQCKVQFVFACRAGKSLIKGVRSSGMCAVGYLQRWKTRIQTELTLLAQDRQPWNLTRNLILCQLNQIVNSSPVEKEKEVKLKFLTT